MPQTEHTARIRYCTGGCSRGPHHAHYYRTDPVDGPLGAEHLCPGNLGEAREWLDPEDGEPSGSGFIPNSVTIPELPTIRVFLLGNRHASPAHH